jgi:hypothetical protein
LHNDSLYLEAGLDRRTEVDACDRERDFPISCAAALGKAVYDVSDATEEYLQEDA